MNGGAINALVNQVTEHSVSVFIIVCVWLFTCTYVYGYLPLRVPVYGYLPLCVPVYGNASLCAYAYCHLCAQIWIRVCARAQRSMPSYSFSGGKTFDMHQKNVVDDIEWASNAESRRASRKKKKKQRKQVLQHTLESKPEIHAPHCHSPSHSRCHPSSPHPLPALALSLTATTPTGSGRDVRTIFRVPSLQPAASSAKANDEGEEKEETQAICLPGTRGIQRH